MPKRMTKKEFMELHANMCKLMQDITRKKNSDYTSGIDDPFSNFRKIGELLPLKNVDTVMIGFITRMSDKLSRIASYVEKGSFQVKDESFVDTCLDLANYSILMLGYHVEQVRENPMQAVKEPSFEFSGTDLGIASTRPQTINEVNGEKLANKARETMGFSAGNDRPGVTIEGVIGETIDKVQFNLCRSLKPDARLSILKGMSDFWRQHGQSI